ncbi:MAG TPA: hypothetical protein VL403_12340, partial [Candidatus Kryptonia bacterium]|nr:hypothetical protein [Candidatus Kryptonia bacterium]
AQRRLATRPALSVMITQVSRTARVPPRALMAPRSDRGGWARAAAMYLGWQVCGVSQPELGRAFGVTRYGVSKAIARIERALRTDRQLRRRIAAIKSTFQT